MDFAGNFINQGRVDIARLRELVRHQSEADWDSDSSRQHTFGVHRQTKTIFLVYDNDFRHRHPTHRPKFDEFKGVLDPIIHHIATRYEDGGQVIRAILTRLEAMGRIQQHVDTGYSLRHSHRVHVPVITSDAARFMVGGETIVMREGDVWEINNCRPHAVSNDGTESRVHLIIDWAPPMTDEELAAYEAAMQAAAEARSRGVTVRYD